MVTREFRLLGALCASLAVAGCAGNIQIPPPGADNPGNPAAGQSIPTAPKSALGSGPAAAVPGRLDTRMQHMDMQSGMRHEN